MLLSKKVNKENEEINEKLLLEISIYNKDSIVTPLNFFFNNFLGFLF